MKDKNIIVSIIIPCYNAIDYLADILKDIKVQAYQYIETIIVSNGKGQEAQVKLAEELTKDMMRSQVIHTEVGGVSNARNLGLKAAKGDWVCFIDADDSIHQDHIKKLVDAIDNDCDVIEGGFEQISINGKSSRVVYPDAKYDLSLNKNGQYSPDISDVIQKIGHAPWNKLFRRSFLIDNHLEFNTNFSMNEDRIFAMSAFLCARMWKFIPMTGYIYKASYGSAMSKYHQNIKESWETYLDLKEQIVQRTGKDLKDINQERVDLHYYLVWQYIWNMFKPGCPLGYGEKIKKIRKMMDDDTFKISCKRHDWTNENFRFKIFYGAIITNSAFLVSLLFFFQHYGKQFFNRIKRC